MAMEANALLELEAEPATPAPEPVPEDFNEAAYLAAFPDIAASVRRGTLKSAYDHYRQHGRAENRLRDARYLLALAGQMPGMETESADFPACGVDVVFVSPEGTCCVIGWVDDRAARLEAVALLSDTTTCGVSRKIARRRRADAEEAMGLPAGNLLGFWSIVATEPGALSGSECRVLLNAGGKRRALGAQLKPMDAPQFRDVVFEYLAGATYCGNPAVESYLQLDAGPGSDLIRLNLQMSARTKSAAYAEQFGPRRKFRGSIVVCLYGKPEFLFLQSALFSTLPGIEEYEFIYVSNSPELTETLQKEAAIAEQVYGLSQTLVLLPGNAGFGAANNVAVNFAESDRVLITNPDVFPRDHGWAAAHTAILDGLPREQTAMFGAPLFYDDGSLMHAGMFFEMDQGLSVKPDGIVRQALVRVEHYAKGAPPNTAEFRRSRVVPAITGAFVSADRKWYEKLGGFSEEYVFGHYEDADLCLKSRAAGREIWCHDLPMWHLEGKGSTRRLAHEGGSMVNRWHFTRNWGEMIAAELTGRVPGPARTRLPQ